MQNFFDPLLNRNTDMETERSTGARPACKQNSTHYPQFNKNQTGSSSNVKILVVDEGRYLRDHQDVDRLFCITSYLADLPSSLAGGFPCQVQPVEGIHRRHQEGPNLAVRAISPLNGINGQMKNGTTDLKDRTVGIIWPQLRRGDSINAISTTQQRARRLPRLLHYI